MPYGHSAESEGPAARSGVAHVEVAPDHAGRRIDNWLIAKLKTVPRTHVYRLLRTGQVRVNGGRVRPDYRVKAGDRIRVPPVRREVTPTAIAPKGLIAAVNAAIVREEPDLLVLNKPAGLAVHGGSGESFGVIEALRAARPAEELELAHRLDRDTSGLLLIARNGRTLRGLHALLREGRVEKRYLALVLGAWNLGKAVVDAPLATHARRGGERWVRVAEGGKAARSTFTPVDFFGSRATLLEVMLDTGRTHQIRVHAAHAGHPVAGDPKYGTREANQELAAMGLKRMFLHAHALSFPWPTPDHLYSVSVPLPPELAQVLERLAATRRRRRR
jgi:23S rRNA pseudouridine955/2504/2580 synthase